MYQSQHADSCGRPSTLVRAGMILSGSGLAVFAALGVIICAARGDIAMAIGIPILVLFAIRVARHIIAECWHARGSVGFEASFTLVIGCVVWLGNLAFGSEIVQAIDVQKLNQLLGTS